MRDFWEFLRTFWKTFISFVTGGILAVFLSIWGFYLKHSPPVWVLWGSLAFYFFMSAFGIWRKEYQRANSSASALKSATAQGAAEPIDKTATERIALMKVKIALLPAWMRDLLREIVIHRVMHETDAIAWLAKAGYAKQDHPLSNINMQTHWLKGDARGTFTVVPGLEADLRKAFGFD
jgi:hypothetical protein